MDILFPISLDELLKLNVLSQEGNKIDQEWINNPKRILLQCPGTRPCHRQGYGVCFPDYPAHAAVAGNHPRCSHRAVGPNRRGKVQAAFSHFMG